jgi:hypothetical protein
MSRREQFASNKSNAHGFAHGLVSTTPRTATVSPGTPSTSPSAPDLASSSDSIGKEKVKVKGEDRRMMYAESKAQAMLSQFERESRDETSSKESQFELKIKRTGNVSSSVIASSSPSGSPYHVPRQVSRSALSSSAPPSNASSSSLEVLQSSLNNNNMSSSSASSSSSGKSLTSNSLASLPKFQKRQILRDVSSTKGSDLSSGA